MGALLLSLSNRKEIWWRQGGASQDKISAGAQEGGNQIENHINSIHRDEEEEEEKRGGVVDLLGD